GFTDAQAQKAKADLDALIKTRVIDSLVADLKDAKVQTILAKSATATLGEFEAELAGVLMATYSKEQVADMIPTVTHAVIGEYLDFMLTKSSDQQRQTLLDVLSKWRSD